MEAVHIRTFGMHCPECPHRIEDALAHVPGVAAALPVRSLNLTSVLYEPLAVSEDDIARTIRSAGFGAQVVRRNTHLTAPTLKSGYAA